MMLLNYIQNYISTCSAVFFCISFSLLLLIALKKRKIIIGYLCFSGACTATLFFLFLYSKERMQQFYFCFEYAHLPLFLYLLLEKKEYTKHALLCISREEKVIFFSALSVGVISILVCAVSNTKYIYPCNAETLIGNYYFDADTGRGIFSALTNSMPDTKHTLYRFVLNFFTIPCVLFFHVLGHKSWYVGGYYLAFLQAIWNAVSAVLLYSIVFKETSMKKLSLYCIDCFSMDNNVARNIFSVSLCSAFGNLSDPKGVVVCTCLCSDCNRLEFVLGYYLPSVYYS